MAQARPAPERQTTEWFDTAEPVTLAALRGRVVMFCAFQMLCPGDVIQGLPQAQRVAGLFDPAEVAVIGLHSVFEHQAAMGPVALRAFLHEYRIRFPLGIDTPDGDLVPLTLRRHGFEVTPTTLLIDRAGGLRRQTRGHLPDLQLGAEIMARAAAAPGAGGDPSTWGACTPDGCT